MGREARIRNSKVITSRPAAVIPPEIGEMMTHTTWRFTKNGKTYTAGGDNRFDAQLDIELQWRINLIGATFEEVYKLKTVRTGIVK